MAGYRRSLQTTEAARAVIGTSLKCVDAIETCYAGCTAFTRTRIHTHRHTRYAVTHILRRALKNNKARTHSPLHAGREGVAQPVDKWVVSAKPWGFVSVAERKKALVRRPPVQETETGSSKPRVCPRRESEAAWRGFARQDRNRRRTNKTEKCSDFKERERE